jgi:Domain of unknown function (DUF1877)
LLHRPCAADPHELVGRPPTPSGFFRSGRAAQIFGCPIHVDDLAAARTLEQITTADLAGVYDPAELARADVYPQIWSDGQALAYLQSVYVDLVGFLRAAASDGDAVVVWLSCPREQDGAA